MFSPSPGPDAAHLPGGLPRTATFLYGGPGDILVIKLYDHSPKAESSFGNDVALLIHVAAKDKQQILTLLGGHEQFLTIGSDLELLEMMPDGFCNNCEGAALARRERNPVPEGIQ